MRVLSDNGNQPMRGTGKLIKELNRSRILECFLSGEALSRVDVAERTGISLPSVSHLVAELEAERMLVRVGKGASSGGRRPILYEYNTRHAYVIGLDMGGTKIAGGVSDLEGQLLVMDRTSTHDAEGDGPLALHRRVRNFVRHLIEQAGVDPGNVMGIGIGVPGVPDLSGRDIHLAPGLLYDQRLEQPHDAPQHLHQAADGDAASETHSLNAATYLEAEFGVPVFIDNDVNMIVRGEQWKGALRGVDHGVCMTVGTGIGVGLLMNGEVYRGAHGAAGEIGYWLIGALGPVVRSEGYGPLETFAAGPGIARRYKERMGLGTASGGRKGQFVPVTAKDVAEAAEEGDPIARQVWRETADVLGVALANLAALVNPETVVIGGGVSGASEQLLMEPLRDIVDTLAPYPPKIVRWELGERAGIYGAVSMVVHSQRSSISYLSP